MSFQITLLQTIKNAGYLFHALGEKEIGRLMFKMQRDALPLFLGVEDNPIGILTDE
jgi:hypothetical protein